MTVRQMNQILDWINQGYELSPADLKAWLKELIAQSKRNLKNAEVTR